MRLSIRTKVFAAYVFLMCAFVAILVTGFYRLRLTDARLNFIQVGYLPFVKTVNSFSTFYHLDELFDVNRIVANQSNRLFLEAVTIHNPRLLDTNLKKALSDARSALANRGTDSDQRTLHRLSEIIDDVLAQHEKYVATIRAVVADLQAGDSDQALTRGEELLKNKRLLKSRLDFLSQRIDAGIRSTIAAAVREEQLTIRITLILAGLTLLLSFVIGYIAIFSLRPLGALKQAAKEIAAGDLRKRVKLHTRDEIGDLAGEFNRMADAIQERDGAIQEQQKQLIQSERMAVIGRMASMISHEVRNPLNALSLNVELLADDLRDDRAKKTLKAVSTEIERLRQVTESYLALARAPKKAMEETDVAQVLAHVISLVTPECEQRDLRFLSEIPPGLPRIQANPSQLEQAFLNLIRNSMDAMPAGGLLGFRVERSENTVRIEFWDNGPGILPNTLPNIFEPFFTTKEKGTGLGLSITREIIQQQEGTITAESEQGKGARFIVILPARHL